MSTSQPRTSDGKFAAKTGGDDNITTTATDSGNSAAQTVTTSNSTNNVDVESKALLEQLTKQNTLLQEQLQSIKKGYDELAAERRAEKLTIALNAKREQLRKLSPRLAEKYKDEVSLDALDLLISAAEEVKLGIGKYSSDTEEGKPQRDYPTRLNPLTGKME